MAKDLQKKNIVIIEDDPVVAKTLEHWFASHNEVKIFVSAEDTLAAMPELSKADVFIIDYILPKMNGGDLLKQLRPKYPDAKYLMITGEVSLEIAQSGQDLGFDAMILKPFDLTILEKNIVDLLAAR